MSIKLPLDHFESSHLLELLAEVCTELVKRGELAQIGEIIYNAIPPEQLAKLHPLEIHLELGERGKPKVFSPSVSKWLALLQKTFTPNTKIFTSALMSNKLVRNHFYETNFPLALLYTEEGMMQIVLVASPQWICWIVPYKDQYIICQLPYSDFVEHASTDHNRLRVYLKYILENHYQVEGLATTDPTEAIKLLADVYHQLHTT